MLFHFFFDLPGELRNMIYREVFELDNFTNPRAYIRYSSTRNSAPKWRIGSRLQNANNALLRTCKQIYRESHASALDVWSTTTLDMRYLSDPESSLFLQSLKPSLHLQIRDLRMELCTMWELRDWGCAPLNSITLVDRHHRWDYDADVVQTDPAIMYPWHLEAQIRGWWRIVTERKWAKLLRLVFRKRIIWRASYPPGPSDVPAVKIESFLDFVYDHTVGRSPLPDGAVLEVHYSDHDKLGSKPELVLRNLSPREMKVVGYVDADATDEDLESAVSGGDAEDFIPVGLYASITMVSRWNKMDGPEGRQVFRYVEPVEPEGERIPWEREGERIPWWE